MASYDDGLIHDPPPSDLEVAPRPAFSAYAGKHQQQHDLLSGAPVRNPRTICGIQRITFLLLVIIVVLVIAGAVGGGVGGTLAVENARNSAASNSMFVIPLTSIHKSL